MARTKTAKVTADIELRPDGWERFQRAVSAAVKSGPKHRPEKSKNKTGKNSVSRKR
jgi:hypothetical protein